MLAALCLATLLGSVAPATVADDLRWARLQEGASREQVTALLGTPLLRHSARGHERWIYDAGCEVQFKSGVVKWWTAPRGVTTAPASVSQRAPVAPHRRT